MIAVLYRLDQDLWSAWRFYSIAALLLYAHVYRSLVRPTWTCKSTH